MAVQTHHNIHLSASRKLPKHILILVLLDFSDGTKDSAGLPTLSTPLLGFVSSCYQLGSIIGVPIAPWFNQRFGRRWAIMAGSLIMMVGAIIQGFAQNRK